MASVTQNTTSTAKPLLLDVPDDDSQRGRKRRRSSATSKLSQISSGDSTTLRGRSRRRSSSQNQSISQDVPHGSSEKPRSKSPPERKSPGRKYQKKCLRVPQRKRSQSPSRSRSKGEGNGTPTPRRRQRTRSRSRDHGEDHEEISRTEDVTWVEEDAVES